MNKTIAFIPVRGGSKSIPGKNIKFFCGKPLVYWVVNELCKSELIDQVVVATDSEIIKNTVLQFNLPKVIIYNRDKKNAIDSASTESVMLEYIENSNLGDDEIFILVQATSPLTRRYQFEEGLNQFLYSNKDSLLSCSRVKRFFWNTKGQPLNYDYKKRPRRQDFDGQLVENGAFYINTVRNIKKNKNRLSGNISIYEMPAYAAVELDEEEDWGVAEKLMRKYVLKSNSINNIKLLLTDVDGVLTDAGMYYSEHGDELKKFNTRDGKAFELLRKAGIKTGIITSEDTKIVKRRSEKVKVDFLFQGITDKLKIASKLCEDLNISLSNVAYIGDDINDLELLKNVGLSAVPADAVNNVRMISNLILNKSGGDGALREFVEIILKGNYKCQ